ncbi:hypothetical protein PS2_011341 [Malus domestica]
MVNSYPYSSYLSSINYVCLDYALFGATGEVVSAGELVYSNLFDAECGCVCECDGEGGSCWRSRGGFREGVADRRREGRERGECEGVCCGGGETTTNKPYTHGYKFD